MHIFLLKQTPASGYPGANDDLIFSGAGSGCRDDDEDECTPPFESSGDDLITPVYVPPTKQTTMPQNVSTDKTNGTERACDDEDCIHGSGDYGETTEQFTSTSTAKGAGKLTPSKMSYQCVISLFGIFITPTSSNKSIRINFFN